MSAIQAPNATAGTPKKKSKRGPRPKHVPRRTCIACRTAAPKRSFVRIVRTPAGAVQVDPTGKVSGRGASLCGVRRCWARALDGGLLDRALRVEVSVADRAALRAFMDTLPDGEEPAHDDAVMATPEPGGAAGTGT